MKKRKGSLMISVGILAMLALSGCGASTKSADSAYATTESAAYDSYDYNSYYATDDLYSESSLEAEAKEGEYSADTELEVQDTSRKLIRNVTIAAETEEFDSLLQTVNHKISALGGYVENSNVYNGSGYYGQSLKSASLTIRIPANKLDEFLTTIGEVSNVTSRSEDVTDVTLQYVDMESHKKALLTEQDRLLELMEQAESIEDVITIESRLSEVRYQIESMEAQLRAMDNQVNYSTVYLNIDEVTKLTPVVEKSTWERIQEGFTDNLISAGRDVADFFIDVIIELPYIILFLIRLAIFVLIVILLIRLIRKWKSKNPNKREHRKAEKKGLKAEQETEKTELKKDKEEPKEQKEQ